MTADFPPIRGIRDIEALETTPLEDRVWSWNLNDWLRRAWRLNPDKPALHYVEDGDPERAPVTTSFRELERRSIQAANLFHSYGVREQDGVLILTPTIPETYFALYGAVAAGIGCIVNWMLTPEVLLELIESAKTRVLVVLGPTPNYDIWEKVQSIRDRLPSGVRILSVHALGGDQLPDSDFATLCAGQDGDKLSFSRTVSADDVAVYIHSGGTTGSPKLVKLTHRGFCYKSWAHPLLSAFTPDDSILADFPLFHAGGFLGRVIQPIVDGMTVVIPSAMGARDKRFIANYWKFIEKYRITLLTGVPTTLAVLAKNPPTTEDISSLRKRSKTGSTALPAEVSRELERATGVQMLLTYGATEFTAAAAQAPRDDGEPRYGSAGIRYPYTQVKAVELDASGEIVRECAPNVLGMIVVKGPGVTPGYVDPKQNVGVFTRDGYFKTGDVGRIDEDGYLWITGRVKDLIIRSGHNIDPRVIEDSLNKHPDVLLAAAVGKPDSYAGELPVVFVQRVPGSTATAEELLAFAREHAIERPSAPKEVWLIDPMPLTDAGKPDKVRLRKEAMLRAYTEILGQALGQDFDLAVGVNADEQHGTRIDIRITPRGSEEPRSVVEKRIRDLMKSYAQHYRIDWAATVSAGA
jgi:fatty-acyl-CoA synthase